jgi:LysM repeat protein
MAHRSLARILAPLALCAVIAAIVVVVQLSSTSSSAPQRSGARTTAHRVARAKPRRRFYVVKPGDNLTVIASKSGVTVDTIQQLNPSVDPQALRAGQRLRLTR